VADARTGVATDDQRSWYPGHGIRQRVRCSVFWEEMVMQAIAVLSVVLVVSFATSTLARAQQTSDCKSCREYQQACLKNHTRDACNNEYNICMKYCRKK
jgi:hypothetical protein